MFNKPVISGKIEHVNLTIRPQKTLIEIEVKTPGFIIDNTAQAKIVLENSNSIEEISVIVNDAMRNTSHCEGVCDNLEMIDFQLSMIDC